MSVHVGLQNIAKIHFNGYEISEGWLNGDCFYRAGQIWFSRTYMQVAKSEVGGTVLFENPQGDWTYDLLAEDYPEIIFRSDRQYTVFVPNVVMKEGGVFSWFYRSDRYADWNNFREQMRITYVGDNVEVKAWDDVSTMYHYFTVPVPAGKDVAIAVFWGGVVINGCVFPAGHTLILDVNTHEGDHTEVRLQGNSKVGYLTLPTTLAVKFVDVYMGDTVLVSSTKAYSRGVCNEQINTAIAERCDVPQEAKDLCALYGDRGDSGIPFGEAPSHITLGNQQLYDFSCWIGPGGDILLTDAYIDDDSAWPIRVWHEGDRIVFGSGDRQEAWQKPVTDAEWHHIYFTADTTQRRTPVTLWLDGVEEWTGKAPGSHLMRPAYAPSQTKCNLAAGYWNVLPRNCECRQTFLDAAN